MKIELLRKRLDEIVKEEYYKICEKYPVFTEKGILKSTKDISAFSILKTEKIGLEYWHGEYGSGYVFCELGYWVHTDNSKYIHTFYSMEEDENLLKKTKSKNFKNPFCNIISKKYISIGDSKYISNETLNSLNLEDIELKKTIIF